MYHDKISKYQIKYLITNNKYKNILIKAMNIITSLDITEKELLKLTKKYSDIEIYLYLHNKFKKSKYYLEYGKTKKRYMEKQSTKLFNIFNDMVKLEGKKILDVGTEDCYLIDMINKLDNTKAYGINIKEDESMISSYSTNKECIKYYDGVNIQFDDNSFDVITCTMVLHHMTQLEETLKNIWRVLKKGGYFIIKEHDVVNKEEKMYIDVIHFLYEMVATNKFNSRYYINFHHQYRSKNDFRNKIKNIGCEYIPNKYENPRGSMKSYYSIFRKI